MLAVSNTIRAGFAISSPGSVNAGVVTRVGTLRAGKAGRDRACVRARPAFPFASFAPAQIALDSHLSDPFGSFPHKQRGVIRDHVALGSLANISTVFLG